MAGIETRRQDPASANLGPTAMMIAAAVTVLYALPAAEVLARFLTAGGAHVPDSPLETAWGVLTGHPGQGYSAPVAPVSATLVTVLAVVLELLVVTLLVLAGRRWGARLGSGGRSGFATPAQARAVLGPGQLHQRRHEIRPDLYGPRDDASPAARLVRALTRRSPR